MNGIVAVISTIWLLGMIYFLTRTESVKDSLTQIEQEDVDEVMDPEIKEDGEEIVHVGLTSDKSTIMGAIAAVNSIHQTTYFIVKYHILVEDDILEDVKSWFKGTHLKEVQYEIKSFNTSLVAGKIAVRGGRPELAKPMNYARYFYPKMFPSVERIIHIDDDVIVQGDIIDLYRTKLKPGKIAAFAEDCSPTSRKLHITQTRYVDYINFNNKAIRDLNIAPGTCSFNTGVYLADLNAWRKQNITEQLLYWMELNTREDVYGNERGGGGSQPPMMIVLHNKYGVIDPLWHIQYLGLSLGRPYSKDFISNAKLLHWNGRFKPWRFRNSPYTSTWDQYFVEDPEKKYELSRS